MSGAASPIRLELELDPGHEPIVGRVRNAEGKTEAFSGWLGLIALVQERCRTAVSATQVDEREPFDEA